MIIQEIIMDADDQRKLCYLTEDEVEKISTWISENSYTLNHGHFELGFYFSPIGDCIELNYFQGDNNYLLTVNDFCLRDDPLRTVGNLVVDTQHVQLALPADALETHFRSARAVTEAHINADCEPPGATLIFKIFHDRCSVFSGGRKIVEEQ
jgi:hypothetical protein